MPSKDLKNHTGHVQGWFLPIKPRCWQKKASTVTKLLRDTERDSTSWERDSTSWERDSTSCPAVTTRTMLNIVLYYLYFLLLSSFVCSHCHPSPISGPVDDKFIFRWDISVKRKNTMSIFNFHSKGCLIFLGKIRPSLIMFHWRPLQPSRVTFCALIALWIVCDTKLLSSATEGCSNLSSGCTHHHQCSLMRCFFTFKALQLLLSMFVPSRPFTSLHAPSRPFTLLHAPSRPFMCTAIRSLMTLSSFCRQAEKSSGLRMSKYLIWNWSMQHRLSRRVCV